MNRISLSPSDLITLDAPSGFAIKVKCNRHSSAERLLFAESKQHEHAICIQCTIGSSKVKAWLTIDTLFNVCNDCAFTIDTIPHLHCELVSTGALVLKECLNDGSTIHSMHTVHSVQSVPVTRECKIARIYDPQLLKWTRRLQRLNLDVKRIDDVCEQALQSFLVNNPQLIVCSGDILRVPVNCLNYTSDANCDSNNKREYFHVKVVAVSNSPGRVDCKSSRVVLELGRDFQSEVTVPPSVLTTTVNNSASVQLAKVIKSTANSQQKLQQMPTVLLLSVETTNEDVIIKEAVEQLSGKHTWTVDCLSLRGEAQLKQQLREIGNADILYLKNLSQLKDNHHQQLIIDFINENRLKFKQQFKMIIAIGDLPVNLQSAFNIHIKVKSSNSIAQSDGNSVFGRQLTECQSETLEKLKAFDNLNPNVNSSAAFVSQLERSFKRKSANFLASRPNLKWEDVGGLAAAKQEILDSIEIPLRYPQLFKDINRSGLLLYGPPGTGKTLLAKAVASCLDCAFISVKGPELMSAYVGETEKNIRELFSAAKQCGRCVIFFDELDSLAPKRSGSSHGGSGVMYRVVSQLLAEMDGLNCGAAGSFVFCIGATNRPDLLDAALLRPGRFDRLVFLDVASEREERRLLLRATMRHLPLPDDWTLEDEDELLDRIPAARWTGADYSAMCADALTRCIARTVEAIDSLTEDDVIKEKAIKLGYKNITPEVLIKEIMTDNANDFKLQLNKKDFREAIDQLKPSVSVSELDRYRRLHSQFQKQQLKALI